MSDRYTASFPLSRMRRMRADGFSRELMRETRLAAGVSLWSEFFRLTVVAYAVALLVCLYVLWTFERAADLALPELLMEVVVLGFPAALGAAAARLIL